MPQLDTTWFASQLFWLAIVFITMHVLLVRVLLPRITQVMEQRENTVSSNLARAEELKSSAEKAKQEYELALADARTKAQALFAESEQTAKARSEAAGAELERKVKAQVTDAEKTLHAKMKTVEKEIVSAAGELVASVVEKLTGKAPAKEQVAQAIKQVN